MKRRHFRSLHHAQYTTFLFSFIIPSIILTLFLFLFFISKMAKSTEIEHSNTLDTLSAHLANNINTDLEMSLTFIFDSDVSDFYTFLNRKDYTEHSIEYNRLLTEYTKSVSIYMTLLNENIKGMGFLPNKPNEDTLFYIKRYTPLKIYENLEYKDSNWYHYLSQHNHSVVFTKSQNGSDANTITIIRAVRNVDTKEMLGYVFVDISLDFFTELLQQLSISKNSGIIFLSPSNELLLSSNELLSDCSNKLNTNEKQLSYQGSTYDIFSLSDPKLSFTLYYVSSRSDLYHGYIAVFLLVILFYFITCFIAFIVFYYNSKKLTNSIAPILTTMNKYKAGNSKIQCDTTMCDITEISTIAENLNQMIIKINHHINNEYTFKMKQTIAEFNALQSKINPHFLYNILNSFIALNRIGEKQELENAIISLSQLFRYTCEHDNDTTIGEELSFITKYLSLQKIRYEDRLTYDLYIEPSLSTIKIPKLLIQPLVENAVIHGLEPSNLNTHVSIGVFSITILLQNFHVISVTNTGLPYNVSNKQSRVGLTNLEQRLQIFSPNSFFYIYGGEEKPTRCYILLPSD